ncbi:fibroblast growth factor domain-containing protein [Ditylenchus destructor]|nr:fibroblast growth factor domain-containing protein [Ditylenchus destructor]
MLSPQASISGVGGTLFDVGPSTSISLLPPFDLAGSRLVARCALNAQHKERKHQQRMLAGHAAKRRSTTSDSDMESLAALGLMPSSFGTSLDSSESLLNGLPTNQVRYENAHRQGTLFCRSGTWLEIFGGEEASHHHRGHRRRTSDDDEGNDDTKHTWKGIVKGTRRENSRFSLVEFITVAFGIVSIRGLVSQHYLCMDGRGKLYSAPQSKYTPECVFMEEMLENYYNLYSSCAYGTRKRPWYVALRKTGRIRKGGHTRKRQKSSHFLVLDFGTQQHNADKMAELSPGSTKVHPDSLGGGWKAAHFYSTETAPAQTSGPGSRAVNSWQNHQNSKVAHGRVNDTSGWQGGISAVDSNNHHRRSHAAIRVPTSDNVDEPQQLSSKGGTQLRWVLAPSTAIPKLSHGTNSPRGSVPNIANPHRDSRQKEATKIKNQDDFQEVSSINDLSNHVSKESPEMPYNKDERRRRRLEREESQRRRRKLELEKLRLAAMSRPRRPLL